MSALSESQCRLCLRYDNAISNVCDNNKVHTIIHKLFSFWIKPSSNFPSGVCADCIKVVLDFYKFFLKVRKAQKTLKRKYKSDKDNDQDSILSVNSNDNNDDPLSSDNAIKREFKLEVDIDQELKFVPEDLKTASNLENILNLDANKKPEYLGEVLENGPPSDLKYDEEVINKLKRETETLLDDADYGSIQIHSDESRRLLRSRLRSGGLERDSLFRNSQCLRNFPAELYKDGKITVSGDQLDALLRAFYNLQCDICEEKPKFDRFQLLFEHTKLVHNKKGVLFCCNNRLNERRRIIMHMVYHMQPTAFQCKICKKTTVSPATLKTHMKYHSPDFKRNYECDVCHRRFYRLSEMERHKVSHEPRVKRVGICKTCNKSCGSVELLRLHIENEHPEKLHLCPTCGKKLFSKATLVDHIDSHQPHGEKAKCETCGFVCRNRQLLKAHQRTHLAAEFCCTVCGHSFFRKSCLRRHMQVKHSDDKPFVCEICNKRFKLKSFLKCHSVQHTGEHKYSCGFCPKTFASSGNCFTHRRRMHPQNYKTKLERQEEKLVLMKKLKTNPETENKELSSNR